MIEEKSFLSEQTKTIIWRVVLDYRKKREIALLKNNLEKEKTLVIIKPDGVKKGLVGEIISRFEKIGLDIIGMKVIKISENMALKHYGYNEEWFEKIGQKVKKFYEEVGFDPGEDFNKLSFREIGKLVQKWNVDYLTEGKVIAMVISGFHAVDIVRKIVGDTYPYKSAPGTIRGDFSYDSPLTANLNQRSVRNLIHASGSVEEAKFEIELWFKKEELVEE
jgi:nucleoside-diphosphate kinase